MAESCCTSSCCGGTPLDDYPYGPQLFERGTVETFAGAVPKVETELSRADRIGALRVRLNIGRGDFRIRPGLYAVDEPDDESPVLVTANYKLSFDALRSQLVGRSAWILVLNTRGVNVWCAAGKGTFATAELAARISESRLEQVVSHRTLVLPQLGATGVSAPELRGQTGFRVVWGPVRAEDVPAFLDARMVASEEMRRVRFGLKDRAVLVPVELSWAWQTKALPWIALGVVAVALAMTFSGGALGRYSLWSAAVAALAFVSGSAIVPLALPWIPGRAFSVKGALAGGVVAAGLIAALAPEGLDLVAASALVALAAAISSVRAMFFTGSSVYTSPSGVEREMRLAMPVQALGVALWAGLLVVAAL